MIFTPRHAAMLAAELPLEFSRARWLRLTHLVMPLRRHFAYEADAAYVYAMPLHTLKLSFAIDAATDAASELIFAMSPQACRRRRFRLRHAAIRLF